MRKFAFTMGLALLVGPQAFAGGVVLTERPVKGPLQTTIIGDGALGEAYQSGSIAKYVCTLTALRLQRRGRLTLDQTIAELLPEYTGALGGEVTLRDLLANRSGIKDGVLDALLSDETLPNTSMTALEAANRFGQDVTGDAPGEAFDYAQTNWIIVQAILERAGRQSMLAMARRYVFRPARAQSASFFIGDLESKTAPTVEGGYLPLPDFISCAGALAATPPDLLAISRYPFVSRHFSDEDREDLMTITTPEEDYTLGGRFETVRDLTGGTRVISWQSGNNGPWSAQVIYDHVQEVGFAVVAADGDLDEVLRRRASWLQRNGLVWDEAEGQ